MYSSKLATVVAILATAAGLSALAGTADAQISGTTGGDVVDHHIPWGVGETTSRLTDTLRLGVD